MFRILFCIFVFFIVNSVGLDPLNITSAETLLLLAQDMKDRGEFPTTYRDSIYYGKLTPPCITHYHRMYLSHMIPPRHYPYFHEDEMGINYRDETDADNLEVQIGWRIVGGYQVDIRRAPYAVLYGLYCGGSLIAPEWVITAAHCNTEEQFIIAGSTSQFDGIRYPICSHFLHPYWNMTNKLHFHDYDYQLVLLERPVPVTPFSRPIAIGNVRDIRAGAIITVSGWGHTQSKQKQMQNVIRQVSVPIIPHEVCQALPHEYYKTITPRMFCAGNVLTGGKDSCQGDSGGPAVINNKLVGLVSFGIGCAEPDHPGVYTDIPLARNWIREITGLPL